MLSNMVSLYIFINFLYKLSLDFFEVEVDDDSFILETVRTLLANENMHVTCMDSGQRLLKYIETHNTDVILLDILMPDMDGLELMHVLKKFDVFDVPPIICLTANALVGIKEAYLKEGFDGFISKPINIHELDKALNKYLNKKG